MTKELEDDLHNIFSAIFSGRKENKFFMEDFRTVINILNQYTECTQAKLKDGNWLFKYLDENIHEIVAERLQQRKSEYESIFDTNKQIGLNNEQHT